MTLEVPGNESGDTSKVEPNGRTRQHTRMDYK